MPSISGSSPISAIRSISQRRAFHVLRRIGRPVHAGLERADLPELVQVGQEGVSIGLVLHDGQTGKMRFLRQDVLIRARGWRAAARQNRIAADRSEVGL